MRFTSIENYCNVLAAHCSELAILLMISNYFFHHVQLSSLEMEMKMEMVGISCVHLFSISFALTLAPTTLRRKCVIHWCRCPFQIRNHTSVQIEYFPRCTFRRGWIEFAIDRSDLLFQIWLQYNFELFIAVENTDELSWEIQMATKDWCPDRCLSALRLALFFLSLPRVRFQLSRGIPIDGTYRLKFFTFNRSETEQRSFKSFIK